MENTIDVDECGVSGFEESESRARKWHGLGVVRSARNSGGCEVEIDDQNGSSKRTKRRRHGRCSVAKLRKNGRPRHKKINRNHLCRDKQSQIATSDGGIHCYYKKEWVKLLRRCGILGSQLVLQAKEMMKRWCTD